MKKKKERIETLEREVDALLKALHTHGLDLGTEGTQCSIALYQGGMGVDIPVYRCLYNEGHIGRCSIMKRNE